MQAAFHQHLNLTAGREFHRPRRRWPLPDLVLLAIELAVLVVWLAIVLLAT